MTLLKRPEPPPGSASVSSTLMYSGRSSEAYVLREGGIRGCHNDWCWYDLGVARNWHYEARKAELDAAEAAAAALAEAEAAAEAARLAAEAAAERERIMKEWAERIEAAVAAVEEETFLVEVFDLLVFRCAQDMLGQKVKDHAAKEVAKREEKKAREKADADRAGERDRLKNEREAKAKARAKKEKDELAAMKKAANDRSAGLGVSGWFDSRPAE